MIKYLDKKIGFFFLDAEKAFDNVNWQFMKKLFEIMIFGPKFLNVINEIYSEQKAEIRINRDMTEIFTIQKGTRQGCPLSPLLFILVLEVLLTSIQKDDRITGIKNKNHHFKYQAYADFISPPD